VASEITYQVSTEVAANFKNFFQKFDADLKDLGIVSYGVSITTLEEVFLKIN
jgi:ATP-binding cassette subfamily A (ABC1) protein 3